MNIQTFVRWLIAIGLLARVFYTSDWSVGVLLTLAFLGSEI